MRIIAGNRKGARIFAPKGRSTRPTGDRVREAAFRLIGPVEGAAVLDLFAGSGAMGLEALSRGAALAAFVAAARRYDLILVDPPYEDYPELQKTLAIYLSRLLEPGGVVVVETG